MHTFMVFDVNGPEGDRVWQWCRVRSEGDEAGFGFDKVVTFRPGGLELADEPLPADWAKRYPTKLLVPPFDHYEIVELNAAELEVSS